MSRALELAKGHGNVLVSGGQVAFNRWQLDEYYAAAKADGLRQAAEILAESASSLRLHMAELTAQEVRNIHAYMEWKYDAILALIPK